MIEERGFNLSNIRENVKTSFMPKVREPEIGDNCEIKGLVIGAVIIANDVIIEETSVIRGDEGFDLFINSGTKIGKGVVIHGLETEDKGIKVDKNIVKIAGKEYSVYVGKDCILSDDVQAHGPASIMDGAIMMPGSFIFKAVIGKDSIVGQGAKVIGVVVPEGRYIKPNMVVSNQEKANSLPLTSEVKLSEALPQKDYLADKNLEVPLKIIKGENSYIEPEAVIVGKVTLREKVYVAPYAFVIADKDEIVIGSKTNVQDRVILTSGNKIDGVLIDTEVSLAHQAKIFGGTVGKKTFIGMQSELYDVNIGKHCVIEPGCTIENVNISDNRYVPSGSIISTQEQADELPIITDDYSFKDLNHGVVHVNEQLAEQNAKKFENEN